MKSLNRRDFIRNSMGVAASYAVLPGAAVQGANDRIVIGVMGIGGRGTYLAERFAARPDAEVAFLADPDQRRHARVKAAVEGVQQRRPRLVQDFREILENKDVDVLINATPDHWHGLGTIMACQAGKDVYVEKPLAHNIWEGIKMVEAARKYDRVVQVGMQTRSAPYVRLAKQYIDAGNLGKIHLVRVYNMMRHGPQKSAADAPVPDGFDYDLWCGPAPMHPYNPSRRWLNYWDYSCGPIAGDAVHQLDLARLLTGDIACPDAVSQVGRIDVLRDGRDTPDTQQALFEYPDLTMTLEAALWTPYMKKTPIGVRDSDQFPSWPFSSTKVEVLGSNGFMYFGRHGGGWEAYDADGELVHSEFGRQADAEHQDDFLQSVRRRRRPNADVEIGHQSVLLCHLANISYRMGNQRLEFDATRQTFRRNEQAAQLIRRAYRSPWALDPIVA